jgi:hypothetical protein
MFPLSNGPPDLVFGYTLTLLIVAIIGANRGHKVWTSSVKQTDFLAPSGAQKGGFQPGPGIPQGQYPPAEKMTTPMAAPMTAPTYASPPPGSYAGQPVPSPQPQNHYPQV